MALEPLGVQAIAKDVDKFLSDLTKMQQAIAKTAEAAQQGGAGAIAAGTDMAAMGTAAASAAGGVSTLGIAAAMTAVEIGKALVNAIKDATLALIDFVGESIQVAGRFQELIVSAQLLGQRMGFSETQISGFISQMKDLGIRTDVAAKAVAEFARRGLDMTKVVDLARVAQNAAILAHTDSSETLDRLIWGITTYNTRVLRTAGILVNFKQTVDETGRALTTQERAQQALNAVLAEGQRITGLYLTAQQLASKASRTLSGRLIPELQAAIGAPFQQAWYTVVDAVSRFVVTLTKAISEGGALYPVMVQIGAIASIVADAFAELVNVAIRAIEGFRVEINDGLVSVVEDSFKWGVEIVSALADGIIRAATTVLVAAMQFVGSILAGWLGPGSPPRVAPAIDQWGADTLTEWLKGFTDADFSVLGGIQRILKDQLDELEFGDIIGRLTRALSTGVVDPALFSDIAAGAEQFGAEIAELTRRQLALSAATEQATAAQKALDEAQRKYTQAQKKTRGLIEKYNKLLVEGADPATLDAALAQIQAAEKQEAAAGEQVVAAREANEEAKAGLDPLREQVKLQEQLVKQLLELAKVQEKAGRGGAKGRKGAAPKLPKLAAEDLVPDFPDVAASITDALGKAIDQARMDLEKKFDEIFKPLKDTINNFITSPEFQALQTEFQKFGDTVKQVWDEVVKPKIIESWNNDLKPIFDQMGVAINVAATIIGTGLGIIAQFWEDHKDVIIPIITFIWDTIRMVIGTALEFIKGIILIALDILSGDWEKAWNDMNIMVGNIMGWINETIGGYVDDFLTNVETFITDLETAWQQGWDDVALAFGTFVDDSVEAVSEWIDDLVGTDGLIPTMVDDFLTNIETLVDDLVGEGGFFPTMVDDAFSVVEDADWIGLGKSMIQGMIDGVGKMGTLLANAIKQLIDDAIAAVKRAFGIPEGSTATKVTPDVGAAMARGLLAGWRKTLAGGFPVPDVAGPNLNMGRVMAPGAAMPRLGTAAGLPAALPAWPMMAAQPVLRPIALQVGPNYISSDMDWAVMKGRILQIVAQAM